MPTVPGASQSQMKPQQQKKKMTEVGNYKLMSLKLGEGATSRVELASHKILGTKVAMKILSLRDIEDPYVLKNMKRETVIMSRLNHPNVARLLEAQCHRDYYFLMMELYPGGDLLDYLTLHVRMREVQARSTFHQIMRGLEYIHAQGVVHRDIKLENIMMDGTRTRVVISDFGLSHTMKDGQILRTRCGTEEYAAPELLDNKTNYGKEVDIWSSGIVLYTLLVGERPFCSTGSTRRFVEEIKLGLQESQHTALARVRCSREARLLLSQLLTPVQERIKMADILLHGWMVKQDLVVRVPAKQLDGDQELQVAKSVQTRLGLSNWTPAQILAYVKSSKGMLGKTAGIFNILAMTMERNSKKVLEVQTKSDKKENDLHAVKVVQKKNIEWERKEKRLERIKN